MENEITGEMLLNRNIREIPTLLNPLFPKSGLVCLAGSSDTGKSALLRQLSMSVSAGLKTFLGMKLNVIHRSAIYVSTEDDEIANAYLIARQNIDLKLSPQSLNGLRFLFDSEDVVEELDRRLTANPADLVVVDCFSDLYVGSMNEGNQVRQFLMQYSQLANKHKCLVIFLHHCGKRTETFMPSKHNLLGSQAFEAKMRLVLELRSDIADVTYKHLCCVKGNYLSADYKSESIKLLFSEHLTFKETGERVPFENLVPIDTNREAKYQRAIQMKEKGLTYEQIAQKLGYKDKSSVTKLIQSYENKKKN
ncbi:MAG: AAA family ATPase [Prevotella sp.]|nr:AAA family ATPase [Prevotella sp.]